ncbi:MAG: hypothetical protein EXS38_04550 [Opitutus sp.]|nr:hypothetical protein [Opitutus sp.]
MSSRLKSLLLALAILGLSALLLQAPPDGRERLPLAQFVGRFHPVVVHFPIALVLLVPFLELAGRRREGWSYLRSAAGVVLGIGTAGVLLATMLGWMLAWSGGYSGSLVLRHFQGGMFLSVASLLCLTLRQRRDAGTPYALALLGTVLLMGWTSHLGGSLTHGENYLTQHMPARMRRWLALAPSPTTTREGATFYAARIEPILENNCVTCHNANKHKGELRLESYTSLIKGGEHGTVIEPRGPKRSELFIRITLPPDDKHFMPSDGKKPLTADEVKLIELWIAAGASATQPLAAIAGAPGIKSPAEVVALAPDYRPRLPQIVALTRSSRVLLLPRSQIPTDGLVLRTADAPIRCDDAMLESLRPIADLIVDAELARTKVTDAGMKSIAGWPNLRTVDLSHTDIGPAGLDAFMSLKRLESINLTETLADEASIARLRLLPALVHIHVFGLRHRTADARPASN